MTGLNPGFDLADQLANLTPADAQDAAEGLRVIAAAADADDPPNMRARDRLLRWSIALDDYADDGLPRWQTTDDTGRRMTPWTK